MTITCKCGLCKEYSNLDRRIKYKDFIQIILDNSDSVRCINCLSYYISLTCIKIKEDKICNRDTEWLDKVSSKLLYLYESNVWEN